MQIDDAGYQNMFILVMVLSVLHYPMLVVMTSFCDVVVLRKVMLVS